MPRRSDSRDRMLRSAAELLRTQGYAATGWRQVVAESGAPWGSQAHHFPGGKEQLAVEAIGLAAAALERGIRAAFAGRHPAEAVERWAHAAADELSASGWAQGCPVATVTLETAHTSEALAAAGAAALARWHAVVAEALTDAGVPAAEAGSLATLVVAGVEGGLLMARA
ncbi:MAG TPA: TetR family transcriptional regulator, partial [Pseudonocardia sp.]|nr:TetR family transcriptional regulator [Pseudonocardia sp.]